MSAAAASVLAPNVLLEQQLFGFLLACCSAHVLQVGSGQGTQCKHHIRATCTYMLPCCSGILEVRKLKSASEKLSFLSFMHGDQRADFRLKLLCQQGLTQVWLT